MAQSGSDEKAAIASSGFTLIEVVIALALFALVSVAALALVEAVIRVEERTSGRLERLAELQRAMFLLTRDLEQAASGSLRETEAGIAFERQGGSIYEGGRAIAYSFAEGRILRLVGDPASGGRSQQLLSGVSSAAWTFYFPGRGWEEDMPDLGGGVPEQPTAVAVDIQLDPGSAPSGLLRRVVELPTPARTQIAPVPVPPV